jgi:hypothetical protein
MGRPRTVCGSYRNTDIDYEYKRIGKGENGRSKKWGRDGKITVGATDIAAWSMKEEQLKVSTHELELYDQW